MSDPNVEAFRRKVMERGLNREDLAPDPFRQFEQWYREVIDLELPEPNAMILATVSPDGQPWQRTVLLKLFDEQGFVFFTNYHSRKAEQIAGNPRVSLLFPWHPLGRQVKVTGKAAKVSTAESMKYFATRPRGSQIGAWASPQSKVISRRSLLEAKVEEMKRKFAEGQIPLPDFWGGYRVHAESIEFWQARDSRLHDRFYFSLGEDGVWSVDRLAP